MISNDCKRERKTNNHRHLSVYGVGVSDLDLFFSWAPSDLKIIFKISDLRLD